MAARRAWCLGIGISLHWVVLCILASLRVCPQMDFFFWGGGYFLKLASFSEWNRAGVYSSVVEGLARIWFLIRKMKQISKQNPKSWYRRRGKITQKPRFPLWEWCHTKPFRTCWVRAECFPCVLLWTPIAALRVPHFTIQQADIQDRKSPAHVTRGFQPQKPDSNPGSFRATPLLDMSCTENAQLCCSPSA